MSVTDARAHDLDGDRAWIPVLAKRPVLADTRHRLPVDAGVAVEDTHARLDVYPDGGLSRFRLWAVACAEISGQSAGLELRHRQHARVEDRIRQAKATGLQNLPCRAFNENAAWLQVVLMATDLIAWTKLIAFADTPALARCEIAAFRYRVLHVAARITRTARQTRLRIDKTWRWATEIATGYHRIRAAFG